MVRVSFSRTANMQLAEQSLSLTQQPSPRGAKARTISFGSLMQEQYILQCVGQLSGTCWLCFFSQDFYLETIYFSLRSSQCLLLIHCLAVSGRVGQKILVEWYLCFGVVFLCPFQFLRQGLPIKLRQAWT